MNNAYTFDSYSDSYKAHLNEGLSVSGETSEFFARSRVQWLATRLRGLSNRPKKVLDFGCGIGGTTPILREILGVETITGVDVSARSIEHARRQFGSERTHFTTIEEHVPDGTADLAYCNGVFHHIPVEQRAQAVNQVYRSLRTDGLFAFWENNPWNPATRYVMSRVKFDADAITLPPPEARSLLASGGFGMLLTDFQFVFPRILRLLRPIEPMLARYPLGAQYMVLCRKTA